MTKLLVNVDLMKRICMSVRRPGVLVACPKLETFAPEVATLAAISVRARAAFYVFIAVSWLAVPLGSIAAPEIEGYDLVNTARFDRTRFDYTYSLRVRVDSRSYTSASVAVSSSSPVTQVISASVLLGDIDAGTLVRSESTFAIRQDRTVAFDPAVLRFSFSGAERVPTGSGPRIGSVDFLQLSGRPGHEGLLPIQQVDPVAGSTLTLNVATDIDIASTSYSFISSSGSVLGTGSLGKTTDLLPSYQALVTIPIQEFRIAVVATSTAGQTSQWISARSFVPRAFRLELRPKTALLQRGQSVTVVISVASTTESGRRKVRLLLPTGFTGQAGPWDILLVPGQVSEVSTVLVAPSASLPYQIHTVGVSISEGSSSASAAVSNLQFTVK